MKSCCLLHLLIFSFVPVRMTGRKRGQQIKVPYSAFSNQGVAPCIPLDPRLAVCFHLALLCYPSYFWSSVTAVYAVSYNGCKPCWKLRTVPNPKQGRINLLTRFFFWSVIKRDYFFESEICDLTVNMIRNWPDCSYLLREQLSSITAKFCVLSTEWLCNFMQAQVFSPHVWSTAAGKYHI